MEQEEIDACEEYYGDIQQFWSAIIAGAYL